MIHVLHGLLLEELAISTFGHDLDRVIVGCGPVESVSECLTYDRAT
jgi:hypothetical protein